MVLFKNIRLKSNFIFWIGCSLSLFLILIGYRFLKKEERASVHDKPAKEISYFFPKGHFTSQIIDHLYYSLGYSAFHKQPEFTIYISTPEHLIVKVRRSNKFKPDPLVKEGSATLVDYKGSGYSRGHHVPVADMLFEKTAMEETFYLSNISPQIAAFNGGIWVVLENLVRHWVKEEGDLIILSGPVLEKGREIQGSIGKGKVTIPWAFYKIILKNNGDETKIISFIVPHQKVLGGIDKLKEFVISVDRVEQVTGIDFFYQLPEQWQNQWESQTCAGCWSW